MLLIKSTELLEDQTTIREYYTDGTFKDFIKKDYVAPLYSEEVELSDRNHESRVARGRIKE